MRFLAVACLAVLLILVQGPDVGAQDAKSTAGSEKKTAAGGKNADDKKADDKKADDKKADDKKAETPPPGTESDPEDTSQGWFSGMIHSGATGLLIDGGQSGYLL